MLFCVLGGTIPGGRNLLTGWCSHLSKHLLSLPQWVYRLNYEAAQWIDAGNPVEHYVKIWSSLQLLFLRRLCQKKYPNLAAYYERLKSRPSIDTTWPLCWKENPEGENHLKEIWGPERLEAFPPGVTTAYVALYSSWLRLTEISVCFTVVVGWKGLFIFLWCNRKQ